MSKDYTVKTDAIQMSASNGGPRSNLVETDVVRLKGIKACKAIVGRRIAWTGAPADAAQAHSVLPCRASSWKYCCAHNFKRILLICIKLIEPGGICSCIGEIV